MSLPNNTSSFPTHYLVTSCNVGQSLGLLFQALKGRIPLDGIRVGFLDNAMMTTYWLRHHSPSGGPPVPSAFIHTSPEIREFMTSSSWDLDGNWMRIINEPQSLVMGRIFADQMQGSDYSLIHVRASYDDSKRGHFILYVKGKNRFTAEHLDIVLEYDQIIMLLLAAIIKDFMLQQLQAAAFFTPPARSKGNDVFDIVAVSASMRELIAKLEKVAHLPTSVLLMGETGVGKEIMADFIHMHSPRRNMPFVKINCGAIPPSLLDSELFGYEKGAFTGATGQKAGCFEQANTGTLFLDEAGEMPLDVQVRLLRVLQTGTFQRLGGTRTLHADVRIIAATNKNLEHMVRDGLFREDLYYRLNVYALRIPPLRERTEDLTMLIKVLLRHLVKKLNISVPPMVRPKNIKSLSEYPWRGNVRELQNAIETSLINHTLSNNKEFWISPQNQSLGPNVAIHAPATAKPSFPVELSPAGIFPSFDDAVCQILRQALEKCEGKIYGKGGAAELLGLKASTLWGKLNKYSIVPGDFH